MIFWATGCPEVPRVSARELFKKWCKLTEATETQKLLRVDKMCDGNAQLNVYTQHDAVYWLWQNLHNTQALDAMLRQFVSSDHIIELNTQLTHMDKHSDASVDHVSTHSNILADSDTC